MGATAQPTRLPPSGPIGVVTRRTPTPAAAAAPKSSSGWLSSSDSISHGRFAPGMLLDGRYRIIEMLGKGGMGEVYRADDLRLGQQVALKFLPETLRTDAVRLAQFHNEVRTAREVSHPNVCRVHDIGEADGLLYLSMEYVDGEDLSSSLKRIGRFPEDKALDIARQLCAGLAAAHQRGIIHRDLKPANIMLDGEGHVRIMDFGLARVGQVDDVRAGTPAYMAPEQLLGREVTPRSDIFALGLVLYELFTGKRAFNATTVGELVSQHETRTLTPPTSIVSAMDVSIERAILRCLEPDPGRRPASALSVAAGETPSPEMVAAAGEGAGLSRRVAWSLMIGIVAGVAGTFALALRSGPFDLMRPEYSRDVLAQKARDALSQLGYPARARDEAFGFSWNNDLIEHIEKRDAPSPRWNEILTRRPTPLSFWYRQSAEPLTALAFHSDLLTPGIVDPVDPPPVISGMAHVELEHNGRLIYFEAIPPQRQDAPVRPAPVEWAPLFQLAGLELSQFQTTEPLWNWLAAPDTRAAWTGSWPGSGHPLRVEAAALGGRPVAFMLAGEWRTPWRMPDAADGGIGTAYAMVLLGLSLFVLTGAAILARSNLREGRGDQRGAARLAGLVIVVLLGLWLCDAHVVASIGFFATFLVAVCTSVFYGAFLWTLYLALEPFVRRYWPQVLVSWTNLLGGRAADPVVGRDVLIGVALGVWFAVAFRLVVLAFRPGLIEFPGSVQLLLGLRSTVAAVLGEVPYSIRNVLLYFFILFVLRMLLRKQWSAAIAFTLLFTVLNALGDDSYAVGGLIGLIYFGTAAWVILHWGLLSMTVASFVSAMLFDILATRDTSAWFFGNTMLLIAIVLALATWSFYTALGGRIWADQNV